MAKIKCNGYEVIVEKGGVSIKKDGQELYFNERPMYVSVKDIGAVSVFRDEPYSDIAQTDEAGIQASGSFISENGSVFEFTDNYLVKKDDIIVNRKVKVVKANEKDLGFQSKIGFWMSRDKDISAYDYFSPGEWYKQNEYAADTAQGKNSQASYFWRKETYCGLPMFAMQNIASGETICISRYKADVKLCTTDSNPSENFIDKKTNVGALGISKPKAEALLYTYYGAPVRKEIAAKVDGLSIDYIYPGTNGEIPKNIPTSMSDAKYTPMSLMRTNHPVEEGFTQDYTVVINLNHYSDFKEMMKETWRQVYKRLKDSLADIDNKILFKNNMELLKKVTKEYDKGVWGTPFAAQLPQFDPNSTSAEIGFVGQQTGIGYQLIRWGMLEKDDEALLKGKGIIDFWVNKTMTETGCPKVWYQLGMNQFEPQPQFIRQLGDGLEGILDAYVFLKKRNDEHTKWLEYCIATADWLVKNQNEDGSFYRAYNYDGSMCMDSKANTPSVIRFLVLMYIVTKDDRYKSSAIKAGEWTYQYMYIGMEYRGGTCDNADIQDKEAGLYALFAFLSLYDMTHEAKWIEAAKGAADYVETFTYMWSYPVITYYPTMPFNTNRISGQSHIVVGSGAADVYMACGSYVYYRLYLLTLDEHYLDYAEFININTKQANDIDGSLGAAIPGLVHESGFFCEQIYRGNYHWLPWCTFVEVDPVSRLVDTFGHYEIADIEKMPIEERLERNEILKWYY